MSDVPDDLMSEVLEWVGDGSARAQAAYDVEVGDAQRTTLLDKLDAIRSEEAPEVTDEREVVDETPPPDLTLDTTADDTHVGAVHLAHPDVDVPDYDDLSKVETIEADPVDYFQVAGSPRGAVFSFNGAAYVLEATQVASFKAALDTAIAGLTL